MERFFGENTTAVLTLKLVLSEYENNL